ncbi:hypothetical protein E4T70_05555 [Lactobacillus johnsonii]|jgi:hypothetical protein|uniref:hypothetical protein n=1 Tax=Lactobacillus johnsonii TaxID=33959 RepID=UPI0010729B2D|nr:hypothetical protein [Lactobacillus johnsonii]MBF0771692.1 hypothetical protein [Lactobacillus johnsonii]MCF1583270.1 hypothetical protein [Lactobacillus johnsonii]MCI9451695.1 hypothetical protein [Lactobacillus johnsonii]MDG4989074.1 hypothetical protein [Lactobacillus johnsonii]NDO44161.1 hypothetical protein [Lactobacillus johnsonii]
MSKYVRGTEHISEELAKFIGKTLGIVAVGDENLALKLIDEVSKIVDQNSLDAIVSSQIGQQLFTALQFGNTKDVIDGFKELLNDDEEGEKVAKEFIKAQLLNILGEGEDDE